MADAASRTLESDHVYDVLVVGAGLSGLVAARELQRSGRRVVVVDKGRSVGGRLATRRIGDARLDHGAQFFTVRGSDFRATVDAAMADSVVHEWCRGFGGSPDGYPRYAGTDGMNAVAKWLAGGLDVRTNVALTAVSVEHGLATAHGPDEQFRAAAVLLTPPVPQSLALLAAGRVALDPGTAGQLDAVSYFSTLGLMATLDRAPAVPQPGGVQLPDDEPFTFVGDNQAKGISPVPAITLHANHEYSARRYDDDPTEVLDELIELARPWLGDAAIVEAQLKKWRYAGPVAPVPERVVVESVGGVAIAFAGDAFGGPKVEGAFNSGLAAGRALVEG